jgi:hypothetical protein
MDNSNDITSSILQSSKSNSFFGTSGTTTSTDGSSLFDMFKNINGITWVIIILILAFLGFNVFSYLAQGTQDITNFFNPILKKVFGLILVTTSDTINITAEGAKTVVDTTANVLDSGLTEIQKVTSIIPSGKDAPSSVPSQQVTTQQPDTMSSNPLNKALQTSQQNLGQTPDYQANEANSSINSSGQGGWCYIGEDQGYRVCGQVSASDKCMSGDIFPTQEICVNPNLRQ